MELRRSALLRSRSRSSASSALVQALRSLLRQRREADDWLRSAGGPFVPPAYARRADQLCAPRQRRMLARTLRRIEQRALERLDEPVTPAGMLRVGDLVGDGAGPLWETRRGAALGEVSSSAFAVYNRHAPPGCRPVVSVRGMEQRFRRGRLEAPSSAPEEGERVTPLVELPTLAIEQILSGTLPGPSSYEQAHDEWVLVLEGRARLLVEETELELRAGDWLLLPSGCPHAVLETQPGTSWLALHLREAGDSDAGG